MSVITPVARVFLSVACGVVQLAWIGYICDLADLSASFIRPIMSTFLPAVFASTVLTASSIASFALSSENSAIALTIQVCNVTSHDMQSDLSCKIISCALCSPSVLLKDLQSMLVSRMTPSFGAKCAWHRFHSAIVTLLEHLPHLALHPQ